VALTTLMMMSCWRCRQRQPWWVATAAVVCM
jgi:hypothetical protein